MTSLKSLKSIENLFIFDNSWLPSGVMFCGQNLINDEQEIGIRDGEDVDEKSFDFKIFLQSKN